ncbi:hypothetical protein [Sinosporangium siamense]|uniref:Uncharacterized protein n=1 Tax=Sinosporangium siamense TaxID=1367973 RepID=A0A919RIC2_9ACTN|nr:hypothetical protein [Sinosporangium siamense]GII94416.1 hypothetical protein Ssi02_46470 [Sinosporangium siamense]
MTGPPNTEEHSSTEEQLRAALDGLAGTVRAAPDAYTKVSGEWRRRERRRRIALIALVVLVFAAADIIGLWALNQYRSRPHIVYNEPARTPTP